MCQQFAGELIAPPNQESLDQFLVKLGVRTWPHPGKKNVCQSQKKVTTCVQPPTSHLPIFSPTSFLVRACASETSKIVKMSVYQRCKNIQLCRARSFGLFFSFFGEKFIFAVDPVHCWSPLVHRSIQNNFTFTFPRSAFPVFNFQFLSFQSIEIDNCYILYIDIIYVNF